MDEKRVVSRRRTLLAAQVSYQNGILARQGFVRNLSEAGAMVEAGGLAADEVELRIPAQGFHARARVVWRNGPRLGLRFHNLAPRKPAARRILDDDPNY